MSFNTDDMEVACLIARLRQQLPCGSFLSLRLSRSLRRYLYVKSHLLLSDTCSEEESKQLHRQDQRGSEEENAGHTGHPRPQLGEGRRGEVSGLVGAEAEGGEEKDKRAVPDTARQALQEEVEGRREDTQQQRELGRGGGGAVAVASGGQRAASQREGRRHEDLLRRLFVGGGGGRFTDGFSEDEDEDTWRGDYPEESEEQDGHEAFLSDEWGGGRRRGGGSTPSFSYCDVAVRDGFKRLVILYKQRREHVRPALSLVLRTHEQKKGKWTFCLSAWTTGGLGGCPS